MSCSIYPMNDTKLVWDVPEFSAYHFQPTDRFYFVRGTRLERNLENFKKKYFPPEGGAPYGRRIGFAEVPGLNFSALKSFDMKSSGKFIEHVFNGDGVERIAFLRLYYGGPVFSSPLLDMSAINYYFSDNELKNVPANLVFYAQAPHLVIYKNLSAWPYYYLAERFASKKEGEHLSKDVQRGTAYVEQKNIFNLSSSAGKAKINLKSFSYGKMIFDYDSKHEEFLVIADAWHPFWKAKIEDKNIPVVRANEAFKGVRLPSGQHELMLYFDTSPYKPGIYISLVSWILFLFGFGIALRFQTLLKL